MSVRQSLLVLLAEKERHGYQLRQEFEQRTGGTWPINIGQVYTTLNRLQRDGLVIETDRQDDGSVVYGLTDRGRAEAEQWWATPVDRATPTREELAIKLALAITSSGIDVRAVLQRQRTESLRALQTYTQHKRRLPARPVGSELARVLVLDSLVFAVEAEVRWLDHIEQRLIRSEPQSPAEPVTEPVIEPDVASSKESSR
jgi:DNA-binding PadR family transcriptional regulator